MSKLNSPAIPDDLPVKDIRNIDEWNEEFGETTIENSDDSGDEPIYRSPTKLPPATRNAVLEHGILAYHIHPGAFGDTEAYYHTAFPEPGRFHHDDEKRMKIHSLYYPRSGELSLAGEQMAVRRLGTRFVPIDQAIPVLVKNIHLFFNQKICELLSQHRLDDGTAIYPMDENIVVPALRTVLDGTIDAYPKQQLFGNTFAPLHRANRILHSLDTEPKDRHEKTLGPQLHALEEEVRTAIQVFVEKTQKELSAMGILIPYPAGRLLLFEDVQFVHCTEVIESGEDRSTLHYREPAFSYSPKGGK